MERLGLTDGFHLLGHVGRNTRTGIRAEAHRRGGEHHPGHGFGIDALFAQGVTELLRAMPRETQDLIAEHERAGTTDSAEYLSAMDQFYRRYICR